MSRVDSYAPAQGASAQQLTGISLKPDYVDELLLQKANIGFVEIHAENYMVEGGAFHEHLAAINQKYALSIHGVALSIGGHEPLSMQHLKQLRTLCDRYQPLMFSEHIAWCRYGQQYFNDLLPIPYQTQTLAVVCDHVEQVQDYLGRQILIENPSAYVGFSGQTMSETEFLHQLVDKTGCGLLLDINNVYVSCKNLKLSAYQYLHSFPYQAVKEIHLAGHTEIEDPESNVWLVDSHGEPVCHDVWALYDEVIRHVQVLSLLERDQNIPPLQDLLNEAAIMTHKLELMIEKPYEPLATAV